MEGMPPRAHRISVCVDAGDVPALKSALESKSFNSRWADYLS